MYKILSIDGGGVKGIIPATILDKIEKITGERIHSLFDLIVGTSTGGIIALLLTKPSQYCSNSSEYSCEDIVEFYKERSVDIFSSPIQRKICSMHGLIKSRYEKTLISSILDSKFYDVKLSSALTNVVVPAYEIERNKCFFFNRNEAIQNPSCDYKMKDIALATSSAPVFFNPHVIEIPNDYMTFVDGGLFANNPSVCGLLEFYKENEAKGLEECFILSLGTGEPKDRTLSSKHDFQGAISWSFKFVDMILKSSNDLSHYILKQTFKNNPDNYHRIQCYLPKDIGGLDDASPNNMRRLKIEGDIICDKSPLEKISEILVEN